MLYLDPPLSVLSPVRHPARLGELVGPSSTRPRAGVTVRTPRVLPGQNSRIGQSLNARLLAADVRRHWPDQELVVAFALESRALLPQLRGTRVYYCTDSLEDLPGASSSRAGRWEAELAEHADLVVAASRPLQEQLRGRGIDARYLPHGCALPEPPHDGVPRELLGRPRPYVGFVGGLNFRLDHELLAAAHAATDGTLVLVGGYDSSARRPMPPAARRVLSDPRTLLCGPVEPAEATRWMRALDVAVVPYAQNAFNRKSFPLKIPQYLGCGLPVVSTPNGATDEYEDLVRTARSPGEFHAAVRAAAANPQRGVAERRARALARPWSKVVSELLGAAAMTR